MNWTGEVFTRIIIVYIQVLILELPWFFKYFCIQPHGSFEYSGQNNRLAEKLKIAIWVEWDSLRQKIDESTSNRPYHIDHIWLTLTPSLIWWTMHTLLFSWKRLIVLMSSLLIVVYHSKHATQILKRVLLFNNASQYPIAPFLYVYLLVFAACWPVLELLPDKSVNSVLLLLVLASWLKKLSWPSVWQK